VAQKRKGKTAAAGTSNLLVKRVRGEITTAQYVRSIDERVAARRKAQEAHQRNGNAARSPESSEEAA
jgi:hypothetical protein